jgi:hypothetical protein
LRDRATVFRCIGAGAVIAGRAAIWLKADRVTARIPHTIRARAEIDIEESPLREHRISPDAAT